MKAFHMQDQEVIQLFIDHGADANATFRHVEDGRRHNRCRQYPVLYKACQSGLLKIVQSLLLKNADPNGCGFSEYESEEGQVELHRSYPLHVLCRNVGNQQPLDEEFVTTLQLLLKCGADINKYEEDVKERGREDDCNISKTPLHIASENNNEELIALLIKHGADVSIPMVKNGRKISCNNLKNGSLSGVVEEEKPKEESLYQRMIKSKPRKK